MSVSKIRRRDWHSVRQGRPLVIGFAMTLSGRLKFEGIDHVENLVRRRVAWFDWWSRNRQRQRTRGEGPPCSQPRREHSASRSRTGSSGTSSGGSIDSNSCTGDQIESVCSGSTESLAFLQPSRPFATSNRNAAESFHPADTSTRRTCGDPGCSEGGDECLAESWTYRSLDPQREGRHRAAHTEPRQVGSRQIVADRDVESHRAQALVRQVNASRSWGDRAAANSPQV